MQILSFKSERSRAFWTSCLASAFRTALACAIVGGITLFGPISIRRQITLPAFSYVTVIIIIIDATLGDTFRGCWYALYATIQGVCPAILWLWVLGPARLTTFITSMLVAVSAFVVVLPENTHMIAKKIALGQIVLVYVLGYINGVSTEPVMHPIHVATSTAVGVFACVLALLFPVPNLACVEVKQSCKLIADNYSERLKLLVKAFSEEDKKSALAFMSQAKSMATAGTKLLQNIKSKQESMQWERFGIKFLKPYCSTPGQRFQELEAPLMGMSMALSSCQKFPMKLLNPELKDGLHKLEEHINLNFAQMKTSLPFDLATVAESNTDDVADTLQTLQSVPTEQKDLPSFFFLFCLKLLKNKLLGTATNNSPKKSAKSDDSHNKIIQEGSIWSGAKRLMPAFKCSLSLFLAVLFGLTYSKNDGYWSGLPVAITFAASREATFKVANLKAQGTVLGTVYGVLGCFLFERYIKIRFISLFPWFVVTELLRRSKMYGQAGGISAVIGAVLILGRNSFRSPSEFAIARIVETFIGLSCSILVNIAFQPTRASTLAKTQLSTSLKSLHECVETINLSFSSISKFRESQKGLKYSVAELRKFILEAEVEPDFWFLPFHGVAYNRLLKSLSKMVDVLHFGAESIVFIEQELEGSECDVYVEILTELDSDIQVLKEKVGSSLKCCEEMTLIKSVAALEKVIQKNDIGCDVEVGKASIPSMFMSSDYNLDNKIEKIISSYLGNVKEMIDKDGGKVKKQIVLGLSGLVFCMGILVAETTEVEKAIEEVVQWENPCRHVNLHEISCKINALQNM
ncbi:UDP-XYL synthase 6 [Heracleum sosnowskyi]|uniref:UDP-XYL synthase 6 n=1 Tax=Heracleum sosnowskyi TaxID=360622 RepID=A0AAD8IYU8_9APIA|nr:UDP-XYL synthase 6 [Heracleum sosnowskyi]